MDVTMDDLQRALDNVAEAFKDAPAEGGSIYDPPPDGEYQALVDEFALIGWEAKSADKPGGIGLKVNYQITNDDQYAGRKCGQMFTIAPDRIGYLKGWLNTMGVNVEAEDFDLSQLRPEPGSVLYQLLDTPVLIKVVRKAPYVNVYLQQRLGDPVQRSDVTSRQDSMDFAAVGPPTYQHNDDDIPF